MGLALLLTHLFASPGKIRAPGYGKMASEQYRFPDNIQ